MKKVSTADITTGAAAKIKRGTLIHLQDAPKEAIAQTIIAMIGESYDASKYYILYGCVNTGSGLNYIISAGAIFYVDEVFITPALTFSASIGEVARFSTVITYTTAADYDPVTFTGGGVHNIHRDTTGTWVSAVSTSNPLEYAMMVRVTSPIKTITLTSHYTGTNAKVMKSNSRVEFSGIIACGASAVTLENITTLEPEFRPSVLRVITMKINDGGGNYRDCSLQIGTGGAVQAMWCAAGIAGYNIYLDNISFKI